MVFPKRFTKNKHGIDIVMCCASCKFKQYSNQTRICMIGEGDVPSSYVCNKWAADKSLEDVGKGSGKIKDTNYLHYALDRLFEDEMAAQHAAEQGLPYTKLTVGEVREEYLKENKTIYAIE